MPNLDDSSVPVPETPKRFVQSIPRKHGKRYQMFMKLRQMLDEGSLSIDQINIRYREELVRFTYKKDDAEVE